MQGLNTTPVHGHTALFGVYGMLGIGLMLFVLRDLNKSAVWKDRWVRIGFWTINIGLAAMVIISVLPVGLAQTVASVQAWTMVCPFCRIHAAAAHDHLQMAA